MAKSASPTLSVILHNDESHQERTVMLPLDTPAFDPENTEAYLVHRQLDLHDIPTDDDERVEDWYTP